MENKKKITLITFSIFLILSFTILALADMPEGHIYKEESALKIAPNSEVGKIIKNHMEDFEACSMMTDLSVFYYFSEGFTSIGKEYKATHSLSLCKRAVEIAGNDYPNDEATLACAYGICSHYVPDVISHIDFVPTVVERTHLYNGIIHVLAEEKEKDQLISQYPEERLTEKVRSALANKAPIHKAFIISLLQSDERMGNIPLDTMYDSFVAEVTSNSKYSVGFRGFTAIPFSIHIMLLLVFTASLLIMAYLIRRKNKNLFNKITIFILLIPIIIILLFYVLYLTNNVWKFFEWSSGAVTWTIPTYGMENLNTKELNSMVAFYNGGVNYIMTLRDPAGSDALAKADASGGPIRIVIIIIIFLVIALFAWLNFRRKKK